MGWLRACDSAGVVHNKIQTEHGHFAGRSNHIHLRWMFISDYIRDGVLKLHQVPTYQQLADIGTKALSWTAFSFLLYTVLGLV
jgi:hypothetical protein